MKHLIIGTAGHVDHGKSALIRALTGIETDRFPEEKERGISIDIGFAQFALPSGRRAAVIDVPGHERFIKNMLAGITGIDLVLLVVAADEGVMPQTVEHLDILRLLEIKQGVIVLTKRDLVDGELLELVADDVRTAVKGTFLEQAPLVAVSSVTGEGLTDLKNLLDELLEGAESKDVTAFTRLPIDRSFVRPGFGTVVTGTLVGGRLQSGDRLEILPEGIEVRVRGLQVHGDKTDAAEAGQRVAVNLAGIERSDLRRGMVLCAPGALRATDSLAVRLNLLATWPKPFEHGTRVHFHTGTSEVLARVLLLDRDELQPGETAMAVIKAEEPVVVGRGDHYILRSYSPVHTLGGGTVVEPHQTRYKRFQEATLEELKVKESGGAAGVVAETLLRAGREPLTLADLSRLTGMPPETVEAHLAELGACNPEVDGALPTGDARALEGGWYIHRRGFGSFADGLRGYLEEQFQQFPLRLGISKEEARRRLSGGGKLLDGKAYAALLQAAETAGAVSVDREWLRLPGRVVTLNAGQQRLADGIAAAVREGGFNPPTVEELRPRFQGKDFAAIVGYLQETGKVVRLGDDLLIDAELLDEARRRVAEHLRAKGKLSVSEFRDLLGTTRKYALPLLEYFDETKVTRRSGDDRIAGAALTNG